MIETVGSKSKASEFKLVACISVLNDFEYVIYYSDAISYSYIT